MSRIRIFRVLLPLLFVAVVVLLVWAINAPTNPRIDTGSTGPITRSMQRGRVVKYTLGPDGELRKDFEAVAQSFEECGDDCWSASGIERFELQREGASPLEISAAATQVTGPEGRRKMHFVGPVKVLDHDLGLVLDLPHLDVDETLGVARSSGALYIEGANHHTRAAHLIYGLGGQATELVEVECQDDENGVLRAQRAFLHDGFDDVELVGGMRFRRGDEEWFSADSSRILRVEGGRMESLRANGRVEAGLRNPDGSIMELSGDQLEIHWGAAGQIESLQLTDRALIEQGPRLVAADLLQFAADTELSEGLWKLQAIGSVRVSAPLERGVGTLRAARLDGVLDADFELVRGVAGGGVRFETPGTQADAATANILRPGGASAPLQIELLAAGDQRARLAQAQTRISADRIRIDEQGHSLHASGRVESTLLPQTDSNALQGIFRSDEAVHFISAEFDSSNDGTRLVFRGNVRGWQGEQNLSAEIITLDQESSSLEAEERVTTRIPRTRVGAVAGEAEFVQITAETLNYSQQERLAVYQGNVHVTIVEGWIRSGRMSLHQGEAEEGFDRLVAERDVQLEFLGGANDELGRTTGQADRLVYLPAEEMLWLYGEERRAEIQRAGSQAGTSRGKVLTYRLSDGTMSVEGGTISAPAVAVQSAKQATRSEEEDESPR